MNSINNKNKLFGISDKPSPFGVFPNIGRLPLAILAKSFENDNDIIKSLVFDSDGEVRDLTGLKLSPSVDNLIKEVHNKLIQELPDVTPISDNPDLLLDNDLIRSRYAQFGSEVDSYRDIVHNYITETVRSYKNSQKKNSPDISDE